MGGYVAGAFVVEGCVDLTNELYDIDGSKWKQKNNFIPYFDSFRL
jgi:hypothetical protein